MRTSWWTLWLFVTAPLCAGQTMARDPVRVAWPLVDFVVFGDSSRGVHLLASPNLQAVQGHDQTTMTDLILEPAAAERWAAGVATLIDSVTRLPAQDRAPFVTVPLEANFGRARLVLSFDGKGPSSQPFLLGVFDSPSSKGWSVYASAREIKDLLTNLDAAAQASALDSSPAARPAGWAYLASQLDRGPRPRNPRDIDLRFPGGPALIKKEGRVLAEFVVDSTGHVRPESFHTLLSDGTDFTNAARDAVVRTAFVPGERQGHSVNTLVWQWFVFHVPGATPSDGYH